jgi:hypothetical protein
MLNQEQLSKARTDGRQALVNNPNKNRALVYPQGFVANAYRYPAPGLRVVVRRKSDGSFSFDTEMYDRKRSYGKGSYITLWTN